MNCIFNTFSVCNRKTYQTIEASNEQESWSFNRALSMESVEDFSQEECKEIERCVSISTSASETTVVEEEEFEFEIHREVEEEEIQSSQSSTRSIRKSIDFGRKSIAAMKFMFGPDDNADST